MNEFIVGSALFMKLTDSNKNVVPDLDRPIWMTGDRLAVFTSVSFS